MKNHALIQNWFCLHLNVDLGVSCDIYIYIYIYCIYKLNIIYLISSVTMCNIGPCQMCHMDMHASFL